MDNAVTRATAAEARAQGAAPPPVPVRSRSTITASIFRAGMLATKTKRADDKPDDDTKPKSDDDSKSDDEKSKSDSDRADAPTVNSEEDPNDKDKPEEASAADKDNPAADDDKFVEREAPPLKDKGALNSGDLTGTPWNDSQDDTPHTLAQDDTPHSMADDDSPHLKDTEREFSYNFTTDADDKIPVPAQQSNSADHNYLDTVSTVGFDSTPDDQEERGWLNPTGDDIPSDTNVSPFPQGGDDDDK